MMAAECSLSLRVYIEDTDAGGIVYYVNYLKFMERARTEFMRARGFDKQYIFTHELMFVVSAASVNYLRAARLDDVLDATAAIVQQRGATLVFRQQVRRAGEVLATADITVACVSRGDLKPRRLPPDMRAALAPAPQPRPTETGNCKNN